MHIVLMHDYAEQPYALSLIQFTVVTGYVSYCLVPTVGGRCYFCTLACSEHRHQHAIDVSLCKSQPMQVQLTVAALQAPRTR